MNNEDYVKLSRVCRNGSNPLNAILYKNSKATSAEVVQCMFHRSVNNKCEDIKILVMFDYAMALDLKEAGFNNVYFTTDCPVIIRKTKEGLEAKTGIKVLTLKEIKNMKFDVGLGNPPYSKDRYLLYPEFFKLSLDVCSTVAMVMPYNPDCRQSRFRKYQENVIRHSKYVSEDVSEHFKNIEIGRISYVIASKSINNEVPKFNDIDLFASVPVLLSNRKRIESIKATGNETVCVFPKGKSVTVFQKVNKDGPVTHTADSVKYTKMKCKSKSPWLVLMNAMPSMGKFNTAVVKNDGSIVLGHYVFAVEVDTKSEGDKLASWIKTPEIVEHVADLLKANNNTRSASKALIARLPWFE